MLFRPSKEKEKERHQRILRQIKLEAEFKVKRQKESEERYKIKKACPNCGLIQ